MRTPFMTAFALAGWVCCGTANAIDISVVSPIANVQISDFVDVDLVVSGLGDGVAPSLGAYDVDLNFDAGVLSLVGVGFGAGLDIFDFGSIQTATPGPGTVNLYEVSLDSPEDLDASQPGSFSLATLTFQVLAGGTSALDLSVNAFADSMGENLADNLLVNNGSVTAVPEPSSALLMLLGLLPVGLVARRFRRV